MAITLILCLGTSLERISLDYCNSLYAGLTPESDLETAASAEYGNTTTEADVQADAHAVCATPTGLAAYSISDLIQGFYAYL